MSASLSPTPPPAPAALRQLGRSLLKLLALVAIGGLLCSCVFFVDETEYVIVETLGEIAAVYDQVDPAHSDRGLHVKWPWPVGIVRRFDRRQQLFDPPGREMFTRDKKNITITSYVCWRIAEAPAPSENLSDRPVVKFFRGLGNLDLAQSQLESRVRSILPTEIGQVELSELLQAAHSEAPPVDESALAAVTTRVLEQVRQRSDETSSVREKLGLEVIDLRIKRIQLPDGNRFAVYERMRTERERIAERYRSAGRAEKTRIESQARRQSEELLARAAADAERIRGQADAEAIAILNQAHAQDPEFYEFQRSLQAYAKILNERTTLILSASNKLWKLLTDGVPTPPKTDPPPVPKPTSE